VNIELAYPAPSWREQGVCHSKPVATFFPRELDEDDSWQSLPVERVRQLCAEALELCFSCPVRLDCLADALLQHELEFGVRGGTLPSDRRSLARRVTFLRVREIHE
jgi:hypothetical protein